MAHLLFICWVEWSGCEDLNLGPPGSEPGTLNRTELHPDEKIALAPAARKRKTPPSGPHPAELGGVPMGPCARRQTVGAPSELSIAGQFCRIAAGTSMPAALAAFAGAVPGIDVRNVVMPFILN